ncbi:MAG TPA: acyltransferase domain-containing protein, partial [Polyangiaceae bacterium]|nr:acyltransferase domain-containing protein [Polyangiaceae bacterium]
TVVADGALQASRELVDFLAGEPSKAVSTGRSARSEGAVFVFSGHGSQWKGMGQQLLLEPVCREVLAACDEALRPHVKWSLVEQLTAPGTAFEHDRLDFVQPAIFSMQLAIAALWQSWGIEPRAIVGHSMGEVAAAYVAGAIGLEDAARIISRRSSVMMEAPGDTGMVVVEVPFDTAARAIEGYEDAVAVAVESSPESCVLSGDRSALERVLRPFRERGIFCRYVKVDVAGHSPQLRCVVDRMLSELGVVRTLPGRYPFYSSVTGGGLGASALGTDYWLRNVIEPVRFWTAIQSLLSDGARDFLEISPHPITLTSLRQGFSHTGIPAFASGSLVRDQDERFSMRVGLGALHCRGQRVDWQSLCGTGRRVVTLPSYPFDRQRFWATPKLEAAAMHSAQHRTSGLLGTKLSLAGDRKLHVWQAEFGKHWPAVVVDHRFQGDVLVSGSTYVELMLEAAQSCFGKLASLHELRLVAPLVVGEEPHLVQTVLREETAITSVEVYARPAGAESEWTLHARAELRPLSSTAPDARLEQAEPALRRVNQSDHYSRLSAGGLELSGAYRCVASVAVGAGEALGELRWDPTTSDTHHVAHPALLDGCFQVSAHALAGESQVFLAQGIEQLSLVRPLVTAVRVRAFARERVDGADVDLFAVDEAGALVLSVRGLGLVRLEAPAPGSHDSESSLLQQIEQCPPGELPARVHDAVVRLVAAVFGQRSETVKLDVPLNRLGLDSLMAVELRRRFERELGASVSTVRLLQGPSVTELATQVAGDLLQTRDAAKRSVAVEPSEVAAERVSDAPGLLSHNQKALAFIHQLNPDSAAYHYGFIGRIAARLDAEALRRALNRVVARHAALRTRFVPGDSGLSAHIDAEPDPDWRQVDASDWDDARVTALLSEFFHAPFDLTRPPLRTRLVALAGGRHVLSLTLH